jgi:cold shock CspA family protein
MVVSFYDAKASGFFFILTNSVKEDCFSHFPFIFL